MSDPGQQPIPNPQPKKINPPDIPKPVGVQYAKRDGMINYQLFPEAFFSGADVKIYFGDLWVDDIMGLSFMLQEQVRPLYSYASRTYKQVARGNRIVQGKFYIAFRESGHVSALMDHICQLTNEKATNELVQIMKDGGTRQGWHGRALQRMEDLLGEYTHPYNVSQERWTNYEREIWARGESKDPHHESQTYFFRSRTAGLDQSNLLASGFDIYITYGPIQEALVNGREAANGQYTIDSTVDAVSFNTTVKAIRGVQLISTAQEIMPDGTVVESYDFIAKDLD